MTISLNKVQEIVNTLPVGYYLGTDIPVVVDEKGINTFLDPVARKIHIGYGTICIAIDSLPEDTSKDELENRIRCLLYHEISHVILTPPDLIGAYLSPEERDIINIFCDERIESVLKDYYLRVDFKGFIKEISKYDGVYTPTDPRSAFFQIVRFNIGPEELVKKSKELINEYKTINAFSPYENDIDDDGKVIFGYSNYRDDILRFYEDVKRSLEESKESPAEGSSASDSDDEIPEDNKSEIPMPTSPGDGEESKPSNIASDEVSDGSSLTEDEKEILKDIIKSVMSKYLDVYKNPELQSNIEKILFRNSGRIRNASGAINTYSGNLDPRSVKRDDYKWWTKQNNNGSVNKYDKIKLNLFVDISGSFHASEHQINEIIQSLMNLEKKNTKFTFDVVTMGMDYTFGDIRDIGKIMNNSLMPKENRLVKIRGGNALTDEIFDLYKQVQQPNSTNYNIVVFDGDALSFDGCRDRLKLYERCKKNFGAFNHSNCTIISDYSNETDIKKYSPASHNIFVSGNYADNLQINVLKTIEQYMR